MDLVQAHDFFAQAHIAVQQRQSGINRLQQAVINRFRYIVFKQGRFPPTGKTAHTFNISINTNLTGQSLGTGIAELSIGVIHAAEGIPAYPAVTAFHVGAEAGM